MLVDVAKNSTVEKYSSRMILSMDTGVTERERSLQSVKNVGTAANGQLPSK